MGLVLLLLYECRHSNLQTDSIIAITMEVFSTLLHVELKWNGCFFGGISDEMSIVGVQIVT